MTRFGRFLILGAAGSIFFQDAVRMAQGSDHEELRSWGVVIALFFSAMASLESILTLFRKRGTDRDC